MLNRTIKRYNRGFTVPFMKWVIFFIINILLLQQPLFAQNDSESNAFSYPLKLYNQEFYDLAAQQFAQFYNKFPQSSRADDARYYAGMAYFKLNQFEKARAEFQSLAIEYPKSDKAAESWFKTGESLANLGQYEDAAKSFETIRLLYSQHPLAPEGLYRAGGLYLKLKQTDKAYRTFSVILERYSSSNFYFPAMVKSAQSLIELGELQKARQNIKKALSGEISSETKAQALFVNARIYIKQGYAEQAIDALTQLSKQYKNSSVYGQACQQLGELHLQQKDYDNARKFYERALKTDLDSLDRNRLHIRLGDVYYLSEQYVLARERYQKVETARNDSLASAIKLKIALTLDKQGLTFKSLETLQPIIEEPSRLQSAMGKQISQNYLQWLEKENENDKAIAFLQQMLSMVNDPQLKLNYSIKLATLLEQEREWRTIIRVLEPLQHAYHKNKEEDAIIWHLAKAHQALQEFEKARYYYSYLLNHLTASAYYEKARTRLGYLNDYKIIEQGQAVNQMAALLGNMFEQEDKGGLKYKLGLIYFRELKDYQKARQQFESALNDTPSRKGDIHLYLGKTYLKLARREPFSKNKTPELLKLAREQFKMAVANRSSCSNPDEASWLMVKTTIGIDTVSISKEKQLIEALINKFPNSPLKEEWFAHLAIALSFKPEFNDSSIVYFEKLLQNYENSDNYADYLYKYAKLIKDTQPSRSVELFKRIVSNYPLSNPAAEALFEVARHYEHQTLYNDAAKLYEKLTNEYYYCDIAEEVGQQLGYIYLKSGQEEKAEAIFYSGLHLPFLSDPVMTNEFIPTERLNNLYFLGEIYTDRKTYNKALRYLKLYLNYSGENDRFVDRARFNIADIYYDNNQKRIALENFKSITQSDSALFVQSRLRMAEIYFEVEDYTQSAETYNQLMNRLSDHRDESKLYGRYIIALIRQGNIKGARDHIRTYKKRFSDSKDYQAQFILELGKYARLNKNFNRAQNYFNEVKKNYKSSEYVDDADYYRALVFITQNKTEQAFEILSNFYTNYPESDQLAAALNTLGNLYHRSEKYDSAITMFKNALTYCRDSEQEKTILSNLVNTYSLTGFWDAAQGMARKYVEKFPYAEDLLDKKITIARAYIELNQYQNAVDYLRKLKLETDSEREPEVQFYIGDALYQAGRYEEAIAEFVKIPLLSKKTKLQWEASALYYSGKSYEKLGRIGDAIRMYEEIVKRPGIDVVLKDEAKKRIKQLQ